MCSSTSRLLEADSKSMRSMSSSRRNSGSSLVSSSSASSNLSHLEEDTWILWGRIVNEWDEWRRKKDKLLKVRRWEGGACPFCICMDLACCWVEVKDLYEMAVSSFPWLIIHFYVTVENCIL